MKRRSLLYAAFAMWAVCGIGTWALAARQPVTQSGTVQNILAEVGKGTASSAMEDKQMKLF